MCFQIICLDIEDPAESGHQTRGVRSDPDQQEVPELEIESGGGELAQVQGSGSVVLGVVGRKSAPRVPSTGGVWDAWLDT